MYNTLSNDYVPVSADLGTEPPNKWICQVYIAGVALVGLYIVYKLGGD